MVAEILKMCQSIEPNVEYGRPQELNVKLRNEGTICIVEEINSSSFAIDSATVGQSFPLTVAFIESVPLQRDSELNIVAMEQAQHKCERLVNSLITSGLFRKITDGRGRKVEENEFDINAIGWSVTLTVTPMPVNTCQ